jgi:hypothetical protein
MKTFTRMAAQGDFLIVRVNDIPDNLVPLESTNGKIVVAHSETGHNHVMVADKVEAYRDQNVSDADLYEMFLLVREPTVIEHQRSYDTHEELLVSEGNYKILRQREYTPEGFRRAAD